MQDNNSPGGVHFAYGKAEVNEGWVLNWYRKHGYKVTPKTDKSDKGDENTETSDNGENE